MAGDARKQRRDQTAADAKRMTKSYMRKNQYDYRNGGWYNRDGVLVARSATEDGRIVPVKSTGDLSPAGSSRGEGDNNRNQRTGGLPRASYSGAPQPQEQTVTPTTDTPDTPDTSKGGQFTGEDLAKAVALSTDVASLTTGAPLNDVEMEKILGNRISGGSGVGGGDDFERGRDLAEVIIDALPPELHNADVANALDFRPYLEALDGKKIVFRSRVIGPFLPDITKAKTVHTAKWVKLENERLAGDAIVAGGGVNAPAQTGFETGTAGVTPGAPASGITLDANGNPVLPSSAPSNAVTFPIEGLRAAVQSGTMTLEQLATAESNYQLDNPDSNQFFPTDVGKPTTPMPGVPAASTDTISALDALKYLYDLSPSEVHNMQLKMAAAGYFDKLNNGGTFTDGDPTDPNTQAAWNMLLKDSITTKRSVPAVLGDGLRTYRDQTRKARLAQLQQIDPSYSMSVANDYAQSVVGHDLTPDELASLNVHLHSLVSARAGYVAGAADNNTRAGALANTPTGTTDKDIQAGLDANPQFKSEQRHANDLSLEYKLRQLMH